MRGELSPPSPTPSSPVGGEVVLVSAPKPVCVERFPGIPAITFDGRLNGHSVDHGEGFQIEDRHRTRIRGTDEAAPQVPHYRNLADVAARDFPNDGAGI